MKTTEYRPRKLLFRFEGLARNLLPILTEVVSIQRGKIV